MKFNNAKELQSAINELDRRFYIENSIRPISLPGKRKKTCSKIIKNKSYE